MFFTKSFAILAATLFAITHVTASPLPLIMAKAKAARGVERGENLAVHARSFDEAVVNDIPAELPVRSDGITIEVITKRQVNTTPVQQPSQSDGGAIVPFVGEGRKAKRQAVNTTPVQNASKSDGGAIVPFNRKVKRTPEPQVNTLPAQEPSKSDGGAIVPFNSKRDIAQPRQRVVNRIPSHVATRSDGGSIQLF